MTCVMFKEVGIGCIDEGCGEAEDMDPESGGLPDPRCLVMSGN